MIVTDKTGIKIYVNSYFFYPTYVGLLLGRSNKELNKRIIERIPHNAKRALGTCKTHLIEPKIIFKHVNNPYLPRVINAVWLHSKSLNKKSDGSMLIVIWFSNTIINNLEKAITNVMQKVDWTKTAENFYH